MPEEKKQTEQLLTHKEQYDIIEAAKSVARTGNIEKYRMVHSAIVGRLFGDERR